MTVSTVVDHNDYTGNGVTTSFPYTFRIFKKTDLAVSVVDLNENITVLVLDTDYTVTNAGGYNGGSVVLTTPLANGWQISIARELEPTQETDLRNQGKFFAEVHEDALDKLTMLIQQVGSMFRLALRKPSSIANWYDALNNYIRNMKDPRDPQDAATKNYVDSVSSSNLSKTLRTPENIPSLPDAASRANKMIAFDSGGIPIVVVPPSGSASDVLIELAKPTGSGLVHHHGENFPDQPLSLYLAWRNGDISAFGGKYSDSTAGAINKAALAEMESMFGSVRLNIMGESVYLPDDMNLQVSNLDIWGGGSILAGGGYAFYLKAGANVNAKLFHLEGVSANWPRLVGSIPGVAYRVGNIVFEHFTHKGRAILFAGLGNSITPAVNPETTDYGCNSVKITHFHSEAPVDYLVSLQDYPFRTLEVAYFTAHNLAGTFVNAGTTNENPYERKLQRAMELVSIHDYIVENDDSFWADGNYAYTTIGVCECWSLNHYNGTQRGVKVRNTGNSYYDLYNGAHLVTERDITVIDGYVWNDWHLSPHKIKSSYQYTSQNKRWYYTRDYIARIKALFPGINETNSTGSFFYPETQDWHSETVGPMEYGNRFIHIDNCDIELIRLGLVHGNSVNTNIRLTNNHFSSQSPLQTNFMQVANYPYNTYQQFTFKDNRLDLPNATVSGILKMINGGETGGGGFTGTVDISGNVGRFANLIVFDDFTTEPSLYANMMLSLRHNDLVAATNCYLTGDGVQTSQFDASVCDKNYLSGQSVKMGALWNTQGRIEAGAVINSLSPVVLFEVGIPTTMNVATGDRYIIINNGSSGDRSIKFNIAKNATATTITFTDDTAVSVSKTTGSNNGTFNMNAGSNAGFSVQVVVSATGIKIQTASSVRQRFTVSGYSA